MPKPSSTELMAARFYEAMLLIVAMGSVMPDAMRLAIDWSRVLHKKKMGTMPMGTMPMCGCLL